MYNSKFDSLPEVELDQTDKRALHDFSEKKDAFILVTAQRLDELGSNFPECEQYFILYTCSEKRYFPSRQLLEAYCFSNKIRLRSIH